MTIKNVNKITLHSESYVIAESHYTDFWMRAKIFSEFSSFYIETEKIIRSCVVRENDIVDHVKTILRQQMISILRDFDINVDVSFKIIEDCHFDEK